MAPIPGISGGMVGASVSGPLTAPVLLATKNESWTTDPQTFTYNSESIGSPPGGGSRRYIFVSIHSSTGLQSVRASITSNSLGGSSRTAIQTYHGISGVDTYNSTIFWFEAPSGTTANFSYTLDSSGSLSAATARMTIWRYEGVALSLHSSGKDVKVADSTPPNVSSSYSASAAQNILFAAGHPSGSGLLDTGSPLASQSAISSDGTAGFGLTASTSGTLSYADLLGGANSEVPLLWATFKRA